MLELIDLKMHPFNVTDILLIYNKCYRKKLKMFFSETFHNEASVVNERTLCLSSD